MLKIKFAVRPNVKLHTHKQNEYCCVCMCVCVSLSVCMPVYGCVGLRELEQTQTQIRRLSQILTVNKIQQTFLIQNSNLLPYVYIGESTG